MNIPNNNNNNKYNNVSILWLFKFKWNEVKKKPSK